MNYYLEIKVLPDPEFKENILMNALFSKLHRAFVESQSTDIGVSFPDNNSSVLGVRLRLHGTESALNKLMQLGWVKGLKDYTEQIGILPIPSFSQHRIIERVQSKSNVERLYRRSVTKGWLTEKEAIEKAKQIKRQALNLPFIQLKSSSTNQNFRLFISQGKILKEPIIGKFNAYGLSLGASVPWF